MPNYNRNHFSNIESKDVNDILNIKKSRAEKIFSFKDTIEHNSNINENFPNNGNRRKEITNEIMYNYKNNKDINNKDIEKENMVKNKLYNNTDMKKKIYYDKLNINNNSEQDYMKPKNSKINENLNKNYLERKFFDDSIAKDRSKFRRLEQFNEENNLNSNCTYNDANINNNNNNNIQRNYNDYKTLSNKEMIIKNKKSSNIECFSNNQKQNYECSRNNNDNYDNFNQKSILFQKNSDYNYVSNENNMNLNFSKINRNQKKFLQTELSDSMIPLPSPYIQRDMSYHRNMNEVNNNNINKEIFKKDTQKEDLNDEDFCENSNITDNRITNVNNEYQRNKNIQKGIINVGSSFIPKDKNVMLPSKKVGNLNKYNEDLNEERINNNNLLMYHNSNIRDKYQNYSSLKKESNLLPNQNLVDKDGNRKKEYHNLSLSTIDSNYSNQNNYEKKFAPNFLDSNLNSRKDNNIEGNSKNNMEYMEEKKMPINDIKQENKYMGTNNGAIDQNLDNKTASREFTYSSEYEYNLKKSNKKPSFKKDNIQSVNNNVMDKQRFLDKGENDPITKNYEYKKIENGKSSPEFGNDNINNIVYDNRTENIMNENKISKGNIIDNSRDYKSNINQYSSPKYDDKQLRKQTKNTENMEINYLNKNVMNYGKINEEEYNRYDSSDSYDNNTLYENMNDELQMEQGYLRNDQNYYNKKVNYKYLNERNIKRPCNDIIINSTKENYKNNQNVHAFKNYSSECYQNIDNTSDRKSYDDYRNDMYINSQYSDMEKHEDMRNYPNNYLYDSQNEKGSLTIIRLPAENKKQVKKKKKKKVDYDKSLVDMYSTAIPLNEKVDPYALKALSKNKNLDKKIYALIPKSVVEVAEYDDITHVTLQSPSPLFVNPNMSVKQHIITTNYHQKNDEIPNIASCVVPISDESLKESLEKSKESLNGAENDKNLKSIIRGTSLRNKSGSSLSVKFKLSNSEYDNKSIIKNEDKKNTISQNEDNTDKNKELNKKIEDHILSQELKNLKIDKNVTEKRRASIFDESKIKSKNEKKKDSNKKIVLDSSKVKKATEIKLKKIQHVTGLLEKYDIPNPFEKYYMEPLDYSQLVGQNNNAKLLSLAHTVSNNYYKFITKSMERAEIKEVFNEKRKKMILKLIALLGNQINSEIKKKFSEANALAPSKDDELKREETIKSKMSTKEKEIKIEEHNIICKYWEKQSECMNLLIKEWNKICEILESINIDPNNMINSLISLYGEKTVNEFHLSFDEIKKANIELDVNIDDVIIPNIGETAENKFDPSNMTIMNIIQDIKWDMDIEYSLNQIREEWKDENRQKKKLIQKKIIEGIKHRIGLLDYLNKVEVNLNSFAKLIEGRMISNDDVKNQLRSMQDLNENVMFSKLFEKLKSNKMDINAESFKTPTSFFVSHHLPLTLCSLSENSNIDEIKNEEENKSSKDKENNSKNDDKNNIIINQSDNEQKN
ncbi:conserved Plasmodium protein, unknown function [Plasmodium gallinaceum]|uniref:Uncharacterized protein n=1 Tax=Plasmodium gallinaceum TaxID=5849 RepID=A0A1J1GLH5_PLAGA|nr:conserved Plasmodium protein, unknown function [Plasmodium gallinaceum]CRG93061.1 conserved Plasmodium protein, unknown function [Plasmodium gallinaceum]